MECGGEPVCRPDKRRFVCGAADADKHPVHCLMRPDAMRDGLAIDRQRGPAEHEHPKADTHGVAIGIAGRCVGLVDDFDLGDVENLVRHRRLGRLAGNRFGDVAQTGKIGNIDGRQHIDPGVEQVIDVLPTPAMAGAFPVFAAKIVKHDDCRAKGDNPVDFDDSIASRVQPNRFADDVRTAFGRNAHHRHTTRPRSRHHPEHPARGGGPRTRTDEQLQCSP